MLQFRLFSRKQILSMSEQVLCYKNITTTVVKKMNEKYAGIGTRILQYRHHFFDANILKNNSLPYYFHWHTGFKLCLLA
ncbi:Uncharacterised protein [Janthinobacterium lividum]|nr:Uncharacterised protein [Janthinobacterium lividum]